MSWSVEFLKRDNGAFLHSPEDCLPLSLTWQDKLGCNEALITCPCDGMGMKDWELLLGQDVRVYDPDGRLAWWGYLNSVAQKGQSFDSLLSLSDLANRVAVRYRDLTGSVPDQIGQTDWLDHLESQSIYGLKEALLHYSNLYPSTADQIAAMRLHNYAWPGVEVKPQSRQTEKDQDEWLLGCLGWMHSLSWRVWPGQSGLISHGPIQAGTQALGSDMATLRVAQSFLVPDSLEFIKAAIRARKQGSPFDTLKLSLQTDLAGKPSGSLLTSSSLTPDLLDPEAYRWIEVNFDFSAHLSQGQPYWLVLERTGLVSNSDHYWLGMDENLGFLDGSFLIYDQTTAQWKSRIPGADLLFRLEGVKAQAAQLADVLSWGGQFLNGFEAEPELTTGFPPVSDLGKDCLQVFNFLLEQGDAALTPLLAGVSPMRRVKVWQKPSKLDANLLLESDGTISHPFAQPHPAPWQAVGKWLLTENNQPFYLSSLELAPLNGALRLNPL